MQQVWRTLLAFAIGGPAGALFAALHLPLPWLLGALIATAGVSLAGVRLALPAGFRQGAQLVIGTAIGLYFTPPVAATVASYLPVMVVTALMSICFGVLTAGVLRRLGGVDHVSAFFGSVPGGVSEMSIQAERMGGQVPVVVLAQSLRVVCTVLTIPPALTFLGVTGQNWFVPTGSVTDPVWMAVLFVIAFLFCLVLRRTRMANAWLIGGIIPGLLFAFGEAPVARMPMELVNAAQVVLGVALGMRFQRDAMLRLRGVLLGTFASTALLLTLVVGTATAVAPITGLPFPTVLLGMAPGGAPEMSITAKVLGLGVPIVTAFHIVRMFIVVTLCGPIFRLQENWRSRRAELSPHAGD